MSGIQQLHMGVRHRVILFRFFQKSYESFHERSGHRRAGTIHPVYHELLSCRMEYGRICRAAFGYLMVTLNILPAWHLLGVSLLLSALTLFYYEDTLNQKPDHNHKKSLFSLPPKGMLVFSLICFTSMACENTMYDWSGIYIRQVLHGSKATATIAFVVYMVAMTSGRLLGDRMADRFGIQRVLAAAGF